MADIVLYDRFRDVNFNLPEDIAPHNNPWAYYLILGVDKTSSVRDIKTAVRKLRGRNHPDKFITSNEEMQRKAQERIQLINEIADVLLDDGGELGEEWSKRAEYDTISQYADFFGAAQIEYEGKNTDTITKTLLSIFKIEKRSAQQEHKFKTQHPEVFQETEKLEEAIKRDDEYTARQSHQKIVERLAAEEGMSPADFVKKQSEAIEEREKRRQEKKRETDQFAYQLLSALKQDRKVGEIRDTIQANKVFEIWYNSDKDEYTSLARSSLVAFEISDFPYCSIVGFEENGSVITLGLRDSALFSGMRKVHFKAQVAQVKIADPQLEGIFQLIQGKVVVEYEEGSCEQVIRARASVVNAGDDFVRQGDRYIQKSFACEGWHAREPSIDIAVFDGTIDLRIKKRTVSSRTNRQDELINIIQYKKLDKFIIK